MAKMFKLTGFPGGDREFTALQHLDARSSLLSLLGSEGIDGLTTLGVECYLVGEKVDAKTYLQACLDCLDAWREKKLRTHDYRRVRYGASSSYVWAWVPKKA